MKKLILSLLSVGITLLNTQAQTASIGTWKNNATGCYNLIHDDYGDSGVDGIWQYADTIASNRGITFTFGAISSSCENARNINGYSSPYDYAKNVMMAQHNHEIMNHSHTHDCAVGRAGWGDGGTCDYSLGWGEQPTTSAIFLEQLVTSHNSIKDNTGHQPRYYIFPYDRFTNAANDKLKELEYIGSRTGWTSPANPNDPTGNPAYYRNGYENHDNPNFYPDADGFFRTAVLVAASDVGLGGVTANNLDYWAQHAIDNGVWVNRELHNVGNSGWGHVDVATYRSHLDFLEQKIASNELWIGTISEILTYQIQKLNYTPTATYIGASNTIDVNWNTPSFDVAGYLSPLTIKSPITLNVDIASLATVQDITVTQNGITKTFTLNGTTLSTNIYPHEGKVSISTTSQSCATVCIDTDLSTTNASLNEGDNTSLTIVASGQGALTYTWYKDGNSISNTGNTLNINNATATEAGDYYVTITNGSTTKTSQTVTITVNIPTQTPYTGTNHAIPGTIENWQYDNGGTGVAYNDNDVDNQANSNVRGDQVDIGTCSDPASAYAIGYNNTGDWLEYSVNVQTSGTYRIEARVTSDETTGKFILQDKFGSNISSETSVGYTGGWDNWTTITTADFHLTAGDQILRFYISDEFFDICAMNFVLVQADFTGTVDFTVDKTQICAGESVVFTDNSSTGTNYSWDFDGQTKSGKGPHTITYSNSGNKTIKLTIDGVEKTYTDMVMVESLPTLTITNPAAQCGGTVDLSSAVSNLTTGATLAYYSDAAGSVSTSSTVASSGTYYIQVTKGSCVSTIESIIIEINDSPQLSATNPTAVCSPATVDITTAYTDANNTNGTITYWKNQAATISLSTPSAVTTSGTYFIQSSNQGCTSITPVTVTVNQSPDFIVTNPAAQCDGTIDLSNTVSNLTTGAALAYYVNATGSISSSNTVSSSGTYYIQATKGNCMSTIESVTIEVNETPQLSASNPSAVCSPTTVDITTAYTDANNTNGTITYWENQAATIALTNPSSISASGTYYIQAENNGCTDLVSVTTTVDTPPSNVGAGNDIQSCNPTATVTALTPSTGTGTWSKIAGTGSISSSNGTTVNVSGLDYGKSLTLQWKVTASGTCPDQTDFVMITRSNSITPVVSVSPDFTNVCEGDLVTIDLSHNINSPSITWFKNGASSTGNSSYSTTITSDAVIFAMVEYDDCGITKSVATHDVKITSNAAPQINTDSKVTVCNEQSTSVALSANVSNGTVQWSGGAGTFDNENSLTPNYTPTQSEINSGAVTLTLSSDNGVCAPSSSAVVVTFTTCTGVATQLTQEEVTVYPNPFSDELIVELNLYQTANVTWSLMTTDGETIISGQTDGLQSKNLRINTQDLNNGIYVIQIRADEKARNIKVVRK